MIINYNRIDPIDPTDNYKDHQMHNMLNRAIESIKPLNTEVHEQALDRLRNQARPAGSLGILEPLSAQLAAIAGTINVLLEKKYVITCAGDHGVVEKG